MLDNKIITFLKLYELMNYRATAEALSMTQPAVTQHIQSLENTYGCKLFLYKNKTLSKTKEADYLQRISISALYNEHTFRDCILEPNKLYMRLGATKTIGDYVIGPSITSMIQDAQIELSVFVDNTKNLLDMLDRTMIDFAMIEGYFDKKNYDFKKIKEEEFVGICSKSHPFANKTVTIEQLFKETLLLREKGSGTREIFDQLLREESYVTECFEHICNISSFELIKKGVIDCNAITFAFKTIALSDDRLATFHISHAKIYREFNYVYLKNSLAEEMVEKFIERTEM